MKKKIILSAIICVILAFNNSIFAITLSNEKDYSEEYRKYVDSSEEEKSTYSFIPNQYDSVESSESITNPIAIMNILGAGEESSYSLQSTIPNDIIVKDQKNLNLCWCFSMLSSLATNLGLNNRNKTFDFSARHMDFASSENTSSGAKTNPYGVKRNPGSTANWGVAVNYLTNGLGAVKESDMPLNYDTTAISYNEIKSKNQATEVYDVKMYPSPNTDEQKNNLIAELKKNIKIYGAAGAQVCGASLQNNEYYNSSTGALYYPANSDAQVDHAVAIIGWDDNYPVSNFNSNHRPPDKGAWIIQNSWGTSQGQNGIFYISYYDKFIHTGVLQVINSSDKTVNSFEKKYDNIYLLDEKGFAQAVEFQNKTIVLGNQFTMDKSKEYLSMISLGILNESNCKVYVNTNSNSLNKDDMQLITLKSGDTSINLKPGFNSIEFLNPIELSSASKEFAIAVELENVASSSGNQIYVEKKSNDSTSYYYNANISGKSFVTDPEGFNINNWQNFRDLASADSTIRAYTLDNYESEKTLESITIHTPPNKTVYNVGEYFDPTGMVLKANYSDGSYNLIPNVIFENPVKMEAGITQVKITYNGKDAYQSVTVRTTPETNEIPDNTVPTNTTPSNTVPDNSVPENTVPTNITPENTVPHNTVPENEIPENTVPKNETQNETQEETSIENLKATVTDITEDYVRVQISNLPKNKNNEVVSYGYYLSNSQIIDYEKTQFIDIENPRMNGTTMEFDIIGSTLVNTQELDLAKDVYLLIKRTTRSGTAVASEVSNPMKFSINSSSQEVIDDIEEELYEKAKYTLKDDTVAKDDIPQTGMEPIITMIIFAGVVGLALSIRYFILRSKVR